MTNKTQEKNTRRYINERLWFISDGKKRREASKDIAIYFTKKLNKQKKEITEAIVDEHARMQIRILETIKNEK